MRQNQKTNYKANHKIMMATQRDANGTTFTSVYETAQAGDMLADVIGAYFAHRGFQSNTPQTFGEQTYIGLVNAMYGRHSEILTREGKAKADVFLANIQHFMNARGRIVDNRAEMLYVHETGIPAHPYRRSAQLARA